MMKLKWLSAVVLLFSVGCSGAGAEAGSVKEGATQVPAPSSVVADGVCGPLGSKDPDCSNPNVPSDPCAGVKKGPRDGICKTDSCDPDCDDPTGAAGAPAVPETGPCSAVDVAPDGVCTKELCDPDCSNVVTTTEDPCAGVDVAPDGVCSKEQCDPDCVIVDPVVVDDPCAAVDAIPDGVCHPEQQCDPDCIGKK